MGLPSPTQHADGVPLSVYVRDELLGRGLLPSPSAVLRGHQQLLRALDDPAIPLLVRRQGSAGGSNARGVDMDVGIGRPVVLTDNSPAIWLHDRLRRAGEAGPDLADLLRARRVPAAAVLRRDERARSPQWPLLRACMGPVYPELWTAGWKLSHILPCSPRPGDPDDPLLRLQRRDPAAYLRVRALRNLSPFNVLLTPMPRRHEMELDGGRPHGADLGEDPRVIGEVVLALADEVYANDPEVGAAFTASLDEAGLGVRLDAGSGRSPVRVVARRPVAPEVVSVAAPATPRRTSTPVPAATPGGRVYQVNQGVSAETYAGILCAPDADKGGWTRLREMQAGDVVLHNVRARIVAVSVVEPMDLDDDRIVAYHDRIRRPGVPVGACLPYEGEHLTVGGRTETRFLVCLLSTVLRDQVLAAPIRYSGYAVEVRPDRLGDRPDLVDAISAARDAAAALFEDGEA